LLHELSNVTAAPLTSTGPPPPPQPDAAAAVEAATTTGTATTTKEVRMDRLHTSLFTGSV